MGGAAAPPPRGAAFCRLAVAVACLAASALCVDGGAARGADLHEAAHLSLLAAQLRLRQKAPPAGAGGVGGPSPPGASRAGPAGAAAPVPVAPAAAAALTPAEPPAAPSAPAVSADPVASAGPVAPAAWAVSPAPAEPVASAALAAAAAPSAIAPAAPVDARVLATEQGKYLSPVDEVESLRQPSAAKDIGRLLLRCALVAAALVASVGSFRCLHLRSSAREHADRLAEPGRREAYRRVPYRMSLPTPLKDASALGQGSLQETRWARSPTYQRSAGWGGGRALR